MISSGREVSNRSAAIVAFYGDTKPPAVHKFIKDLQNSLDGFLGAAFSSRPMGSIHTTLIGLDALGPISADAGLDFLRAGDQGIDGPGLIKYLATDLKSDPPIIQFGGFENRDYSLQSRGQRLFDRSVVANDGQIIIIGWTLGADYQLTPRLDQLRRKAGKFGFTHRYSLSDGNADPDAHVVIGKIAKDVDPTKLSSTLLELRAMSVDHSCHVELKADRLAVVLYSDPALPESTTTAFPLIDLVQDT